MSVWGGTSVGSNLWDPIVTFRQKRGGPQGHACGFLKFRFSFYCVPCPTIPLLSDSVPSLFLFFLIVCPAFLRGSMCDLIF